MLLEFFLLLSKSSVLSCQQKILAGRESFFAKYSKRFLGNLESFSLKRVLTYGNLSSSCFVGLYSLVFQ
ncbi:MAG: hypothetical protein D6805_03200 [Planctomycetota bacterium]|nr:MAG: hypothetical protein D6805_03200 [Planctomycetota bacterium]